MLHKRIRSSSTAGLRQLTCAEVDEFMSVLKLYKYCLLNATGRVYPGSERLDSKKPRERFLHGYNIRPAAWIPQPRHDEPQGIFFLRMISQILHSSFRVRKLVATANSASFPAVAALNSCEAHSAGMGRINVEPQCSLRVESPNECATGRGEGVPSIS